MLTQQFWEKYFRTYDILNRAIPYQELMEDLLKLVQPKAGEIILDAGSGTGNLSILLSKRGALVEGIDYSQAGIKLHLEKDQQAKVILADLTKPLPYADNYFDKIVSNNVFYTLPVEEREQTIKELYRILKPGGSIVLANVHTGFKAINILKAHIHQSFKKAGILHTVREVASLSIPIIKMLYYNRLILQENTAGSYQFMNKGDQEFMLTQAGFKPCTAGKLTYARQSFIVSATK